MVKTSHCPTRSQLEQLLGGELAFPEIDELARHVEVCAGCAHTLQGLSANDTLAEMLRAQPQAAGKPLDAGVQKLIERLRALYGPAPLELRDFLAPPLSPDELGRLGSYRVLSVLGSGGMGVVFQAEDPQLKRKLALKAMKPALAASDTAKQRFLREAQAAAAIKHDHIVTIYQVGEDRGVPFLAMEFLAGLSLDDWLKQGRVPSLTQILGIGRQIAQGLQAAHQRGLIHRDIKPANIWLEAPHDRVKILDFGLARASGDDAQLTQAGTIVGTPAYMSPEQANGQKLDPRSDLFSLGCVLYRLCTGQLPFRGDTTMATLMAVAMENPRPVRELAPAIPEPLARLVMRLLAKDPAQRPASAEEVVETIEVIERGVPGAIQPRSDQAPDSLTSLLPAPAGSGRGRLVVLGSVAAGLLLLLAAVIYVQSDTGTLRIETLDDDVQVIVEQGGKVIKTIDKKGGGEVVLHSGEYKLRLGEPRQDVEISPQQIALKRGQVQVARIAKVAKAAEPRKLKTFTADDRPITQDGVSADQGGWRIETKGPRTVRLYELPNPGVESCLVLYRARIKTANLAGKAYLEMWCRLPGAGEFFSRGLDHPVQGTTDWASYEIPFRLEKGQAPDLLKLNVAFEGQGTLWIKDVEIWQTPLPR